jgi:hypothetical protein
MLRGLSQLTFATKSAMKRLMHRSKLTSLFDHLIGAGEQCRRHGDAERPGGLEIDH